MNTNKEDIDKLIQLSSAILNSKKATYISTPISSGKLFNNFFSSVKDLGISEEEYKERHYKEIICVNHNNAEILRQKLLSENPDVVVINPGGIFYKSWKQEDYLEFWKDFITKFVNKIIFVDEWQYSNGCVFEYSLAVDLKIPCYDANKNKIDYEQGIKLIEQVIDEKPLNIIFIELIYNKILCAIGKELGSCS